MQLSLTTNRRLEKYLQNHLYPLEDLRLNSKSVIAYQWLIHNDRFMAYSKIFLANVQLLFLALLFQVIFYLM